jgi:16S rRNA (cytidine1402-2'-O)-methyltransferase
MSERTQSAGPLKRGTLYIVATPIGNLSDLTDRAREVLASVDAVAAEDTRHSGQLLRMLGISKPLISVHEHNEATRAAQLVEHLKNGEAIALVSDAGTPLISDPGFDIVRATLAEGHRVVPVPGACALIAALSASGLPTDRFAFEGFLPAKSKQRCSKLSEISKDERTLVFYEAPHRLSEALEDIAATLGPARRTVVARELTKQFETIYYGTARELCDRAKNDTDMSRGEMVIVVAGATEVSSTTLEADTVLRVLLSELSPAQAAKLAARLTNATRDELYRRAVELGAKN